MMHPYIGVASAEVVDLDGDVIVASGIEWPYWKRTRTLYLDHDYTNASAVGRMTNVRLDLKYPRLVCTFEVDDATQAGRDTIAKIEAGIIRGLSIGFRSLDAAPPMKAEAKKWPGVRQVIHRCELLECSIVGMPCNPDALIGLEAMRSIGKPLSTSGDELAKRAAWHGLGRMLPFPKPKIALNTGPARKRRTIHLLIPED